MAAHTLDQLIDIANRYEPASDLPICFGDEPYNRIPIHRDENLEIVCICFAAGQTSSVHDHQGSNCVVKVVRGRVLESLFSDNGSDLSLQSHHYLNAGEVGGIKIDQIHQLANMHKEGTILLNFYSPPFKVGT